MAASLGAHVALLLALLMMPKSAPGEPPLTEITLLDAGDAGAAAPAAMASAPQTLAGALAESHQDQRFRREARAADVDPAPESRDAIGDRLDARLASLQQREVVAAGVTLPNVSSGWGSAPASISGSGSGGAPLALARGGEGGGSSPLPLARGTGTGSATAIAAALPPTHSAEAEAPARGGDALAHRNLAGASLAGPIADRAVLEHPAPAYPEWAKRDAVEGSVTLYFIVRPDGTVKENVLVQKTAGFGDFDDNAREALRAWRFAALPAGRTGEQWGTITFHFRLRDGG
jgi:TonB family protein